MRQLMPLHPHKHTGKLLHHKHTSYHALLLIFVLAGVFMIMLSQVAKAADYIVTATVPAPIPAGAPVIISPQTGTIVRVPSILISGTCPVIDPAIIVELSDQTSFLGSQQCTNNGTFSIPVTLTAGTHTITATVVTTTGDSGQSSQAVSVTYTPPATSRPNTPVTTTQTSSSPAGIPSPLSLVSDTPFIVFGYNTDAIWKGTFSGGTAPYSLYIAWGDGDSQSFEDLTAGQHGYSHHYNQLKSYRVTIKLSDANGEATTRSIAAISPATFSQPPSIGNTETSPSFTTTLMYAIYIGLLFLMMLFWKYEAARHALSFSLGGHHAVKSNSKRRSR